jgi:hypothetical protein
MLQTGHGGSMRVLERLVRLMQAVVLRKVREPSEEAQSPSVGRP